MWISQQFLDAKRKCNTSQEVLFLLPSKQTNIRSGEIYSMWCYFLDVVVSSILSIVLLCVSVLKLKKKTLILTFLFSVIFKEEPYVNSVCGL